MWVLLRRVCAWTLLLSWVQESLYIHVGDGVGVMPRMRRREADWKTTRNEVVTCVVRVKDDGFKRPTYMRPSMIFRSLEIAYQFHVNKRRTFASQLLLLNYWSLASRFCYGGINWYFYNWLHLFLLYIWTVDRVDSVPYSITFYFCVTVLTNLSVFIS